MPQTRRAAAAARHSSGGHSAAEPVNIREDDPGVERDEDTAIVLTYGQNIEISRWALDRLEPDQWMTGDLVDFGYAVMVGDLTHSPLRRCRRFGDIARDVHVYSAHFFRKLTEGDSGGPITEDEARGAHERVASWTNGVDVFGKKFLLVPVNEHLEGPVADGPCAADGVHYALAIVCYPGELARRGAANLSVLDAGALAAARWDGPATEAPCIIVMDSLASDGAALASRIEKWLRCYLEREWAARHEDEAPLVLQAKRADRWADLPLVRPKVPQQRNGCDCGVYTLRFGREFLERAICRRTLTVSDRDIATSFDDQDFNGWFDEAAIVQTRLELKTLVFDLIDPPAVASRSSCAIA